MTFSTFVPNGDDATATAQRLVSAADENGIPQRDIKVAEGGFFISDALDEVLFPKKTSGKTKKSSGNRAAKESTATQGVDTNGN
jgi:hypothetical protein